MARLDQRRQHFANAAYGVLDYAAYPIGMLVAAPLVLHNLGVAQYGVWTVATAAVSMGSIIASGFGDANIQHVATERSAGDERALLRAVRSTMGIHLLLGLAIGMLAWTTAPLLASRVTSTNPELETSCVWCLRIAGSLMFVRAIEGVCISTQRAFERYGNAVRISILTRLLSLAMAAVVSAMSHSVVLIMAGTAGLTALGACIQVVELKGLLSAKSLAPSFDSEATRALVKFGIYSWLLAVCGVVFSQADRLIGGTSLGATAVVAYALCTQLAQPIYGIAASGLHFLFPYLAGRRDTAPAVMLRRTVAVALAANLALVLAGMFVLLIWGETIIRLWVGTGIALESATILPVVVLSSGALGLSVTGSYAMLALRRVQPVAWLNAAGGAAMLLLIAWLLPRYGIRAIAAGRLFYGFATLLIYVPLAALLRPGAAPKSMQERNNHRSFDHTSYAIADSGLPGVAQDDKGLWKSLLNEKRPIPRSTGKCVPLGMATHQVDVSKKQRQTAYRAHANILGVRVDAVDMERALARIKDALAERSKGYVCMAGVHGIMEAQRSPRVGCAYDDAMMTLPDGRPTVWVGQWQGHSWMRQVTGPDLMLEIFRRREFAGYSHFLYGGKEGIAEELAEKLTAQFPWARIAGTYTPPFRDLWDAEARDLIRRIRQLKPDIIWVGISTPRQEIFMRNYLPLLEATLMFGVGAAFDFHTGRIKDCSEWVKRAGLQWLHRLMQDPRHLWWRYLRNNPVFVWNIALQLAGMRTYPASEERAAIKSRIYARETPAD
jgi:exopolysaccharide biosynthesis WecB/TagA/CpsF family protein